MKDIPLYIIEQQRQGISNNEANIKGSPTGNVNLDFNYVQVYIVIPLPQNTLGTLLILEFAQ